MSKDKRSIQKLRREVVSWMQQPRWNVVFGRWTWWRTAKEKTKRALSSTHQVGILKRFRCSDWNRFRPIVQNFREGKGIRVEFWSYIPHHSNEWRFAMLRFQCFVLFFDCNGVEFQREEKLALKKSFKSVRFIPRCCDWRQVLQPYLAYPWVKIYAVTLVQTLDKETKYMVLNKGTKHYLLLRISYSCIFSCFMRPAWKSKPCTMARISRRLWPVHDLKSWTQISSRTPWDLWSRWGLTSSWSIMIRSLVRWVVCGFHSFEGRCLFSFLFLLFHFSWGDSFTIDSIDVGFLLFEKIGFTWIGVLEVLEDSGLKKNQVDEIVLVGGSTRIPKVQQLIKDGGNPGRPKYDPEIQNWIPGYPKIIWSFKFVYVHLSERISKQSFLHSGNLT